METKSRKIYIGLISLAVVLAVYLLYSLLSDTPQIKVETGSERTGITDDDYRQDLEGEVGVIGEVGVGSVQKARYVHLNKQKQVDREFGFEKLLHQERDEWEIDKPYMNVYRHNLKCLITADKGRVQIETAVGRSSPRDATLTGNVIIHVVPEGGSNVRESFVYLDDIVFISDRSQFSTDGPVEFVSKDARMLGRGMEIVYNEEVDRLEYLRIRHMESLVLKTSETGFSSGEKTEEIDSSGNASDGAGKERELEPAAVGVQRPEKRDAEVEQKNEQRRGEEYKCLFNKNVVIDAPEQLVFTNKLFINNIFFSKGSNEDSDEVNGSEEDTVSEQDMPDVVASVDSKADEANVKSGGESDKINEQLAEIVITCDDGIFVEPMSSSRYSDKLAGDSAVGERKSAVEPDGTRTILIAERIDYNAGTGDMVADNRSEITFYVNDMVAGEGEQKMVPVEVTANEKIVFLSSLNQVIFEGDCVSTMLRNEKDIQQKYNLSAPKLTLYLTRGNSAGGAARDIERLTADGGQVRLATIKRRGKEFLGGVELKCQKFGYDTAGRLFSATGPGVIKADNSKIAEPASDVGKFSLQRPSYAVMRDFDSLKFSVDSNKLTADARSQRILIDYFPVTDGQIGQQVKSTASHIEANLVETESGGNKLSTLTATGGISYEEGDTQFEGSRMFYDGDGSVIKASGDEFQPCMFNGAVVDAIEYNLKTGRAKTKIKGPGALRLR